MIEVDVSILDAIWSGCGGGGLGTVKRVVDDGKHASRVIEVDSSFLEAIWEGGLGGGA